MRADHYARSGFGILFCAAFLAGPVTGCATEPQPRPSAIDPSNPVAPESAPLAVASFDGSASLPPTAAQAIDGGTDLTPAAASATEQDDNHESAASPSGRDKKETPAHAHVRKKHGQQQGTVYTCPMHPEIVSPIPGHCPKCGMTLIPKRSEGQQGHEHEEGDGGTP